MTIRTPNEAPRRASPELSAAIERLASDPQRKEAPTLGAVRVDLEMTGLQWSPNGELLHPQDRTAQLIEIDDLIEQHGKEASALDFVPPNAEHKAPRT
jgi:hypothetical protein